MVSRHGCHLLTLGGLRAVVSTQQHSAIPNIIVRLFFPIKRMLSRSHSQHPFRFVPILFGRPIERRASFLPQGPRTRAELNAPPDGQRGPFTSSHC